jgi:hypothetical protein
MKTRIENPATCEVWSVMQFLNTKNVRLAEIWGRIVEVCGEGAMKSGNVRKWCRLFKEGRTNVHVEEPSGRPSLVTDGLTEGVNAKLRYNKIFFLAGHSLRRD